MAKKLMIDANDVRFFSGRSNPELAAKIANRLAIPIEETHFSRFSNDNLFVQLGASVRGRIVYIVQSLVPPVSDNLIELLMMLDIAKGAAAREVHAVIPYFSYARSDKKDAPRISITARLVADLLKTSGATHIMTMTLHSPQTHGFFSVPADPLTARGLFAKHIRKNNLNSEDTVLVAPDAGSAKSASRLAEMVNLPVAVAVKTRLSDSKVKIASDLMGRQVQGFRHAIVHDDEIATGGTMSELCRLLVDNGIQEVTVMCTHGLFLGKAIERLKGIHQIREIVTTDTVPLPPERKLPNMTILTTAKVFSNAIRQNYARQSIGSLFSFWNETKQGM